MEKKYNNLKEILMAMQETQKKMISALQEKLMNRMSLFNPQEFAMQMTSIIKILLQMR